MTIRQVLGDQNRLTPSVTAHARAQKNEILFSMIFMRVSSFGRELSTSKTHTSDFYIAFFTQLGMADI